jgi:hypothetical protein
MVYLLVELFNYRQLARLRRERLPEVEAGLSGLCSGKKARVARMHEGSCLVECGREEELDAEACASLALQARDFLKAARSELFGFTVLIAGQMPDDPTRAEQRMLEAASAADKEEELWLSAEVVPLFRDYLTAGPGQGIRLATAAVREEPRVKPGGEGTAAWVRESLVQRTLDALGPRLDGSDEGRVLFLCGPAGSGKTFLLLETARRLGAGDEKAPVVRMYTLFRRRSPVHPFINSLIPSLLAEVPGHLRGPETAVWSEVGGLLSYLRDAEISSGRHAAPLFPDHLLEDFMLGYQLYLTAFVRMTAARLLPAFFVCEGVESCHPQARRAVARLIGEFGKHPNFIPVLSSAEASVPEELSGLNPFPIGVHPLGKREIRSLSRALYPGLELPALEIRGLRRVSGGVYPDVVSVLRYLESKGAIRAVDGGFQWIQPRDNAPGLPADRLAAAWHLMRTLSMATFRHFYAVFLAGGLLDRNGLVSFFSRSGESAASIDRSLAGLTAAGLVCGDDVLVARIPGLRKRIEAHIGREAERLRTELVSYLFSLWEKGEFPRRVLLFYFLAKAGKTDLALRVLPEIVRRKIDERDLAAAKLFCETEKLEFAAPLSPGQKEDLALVACAGRLRAELIEGGAEKATESFRSLARSDKHKRGGEPSGDAGLARAAYFLSRGEASVALDELKTSLLEFQDAGFERGERAAYHSIGLAMLGLGKTGEAIEYLGLAERLYGERGDVLGALRAAGVLAVGLLLEGRLTGCLAAAERAELAAGRTGQREQEIFLGFMKARTLFLLGQYRDCSLQLQACLCKATLYSAEDAVGVLSAWLGRALAYGGDAAGAARYLEKLPQDRETLFFLSETALMLENYRNALAFAERSLAAVSVPAYPPPESVSWRDGFCSIEGRCFELSREDLFIRRSVRAVAGYLLGLRGFSREAVLELHRLTRGEDSAVADPNAYLHAYLYSLVLPEYATEEGDDKTTMLSKSVRSLQQLASRIESPAQKSAFLGSNYWNHRIMNDSRARKLI